MSLINKIFAAFILMVAIAVVTAVVGWRVVSNIDAIMERVINYEMEASDRLNRLEVTYQAVTVAQRTLVSNSLSPELREEQHADIAAAGVERRELAEEITALLNRGVNEVSGWTELQNGWRNYQPSLAAWDKAIADNEARLQAWENTTILNPDGLLRDIMQYRGDHFQLAARLGEMISEKRSEGADINPADNVCAFGRWRARFDSGEEVFSRNPELRKAMEAMTAPHREFHRSAADVQKLIRDGYDKNRDAIAARFAEHLAAARDVIGTFGTITDEAQRARQLFTDVEGFTMGELRDVRHSSLEQLMGVLMRNLSNMDGNFRHAIAEGAAGARTMQILAAAALGLGVLIIAYLVWTMRRQLTRPLTRVIASLASDAGVVSDEAHGMASSSASLSEGSSSQSSALEETSAAIEQITSMARRNLENAQQANRDMQANAEEINESTEGMARMSTAMGEIKDSSEKIGNILKTIEDIAFQTNLLALNAAVEAARAGEAGKGFAVVADEVRNLAQRSAQAVKDTGDLITGTVERVGNGVRISREIETHFEHIAGTTGKITRMISEIDVATSEQTQGLEQINQSVSQIDRVNQENARHADSNAKASATLNDRSDSLMAQIDDLAGVLRTIIGARGVPDTHARSGGAKPVKARIVGGGAAKALPAPAEDAF